MRDQLEINFCPCPPLFAPCRPAGVLSCCVRTQWLQNFDHDADSLTDLSHLSLGQSGACALAALLCAGGGADITLCLP